MVFTDRRRCRHLSIPVTRRKRVSIVFKFFIYDTNNKVLGLVGTFPDITEKNRSNF